MWANMGTDLWGKTKDDEVMDRWERTKAKRNEWDEAEKVCEYTIEAKCEKKQPRSASRPGSCCCTRKGQGPGRPSGHAAATSMGAGAGRPSLNPTPGYAPAFRPTVAPPGDPEEQCEKCNKFGKDECWIHSPLWCGKFKKRGKTCLCAKQALYQARLAKRVKDAKETPDERRRSVRCCKGNS